MQPMTIFSLPLLEDANGVTNILVDPRVNAAINCLILAGIVVLGLLIALSVSK